MTPASLQGRIRAGLPLAAAWGVEVLEAGAGRAVLRLPRDPGLLRPGETVSGPALMGLADMAMWAALLTLSEGRDERLTAQLAIAFLRPAGPGPVLAEARVIRRGRLLAYGEVLLRAEGGAELAAHVTTSWAAVPPA